MSDPDEEIWLTYEGILSEIEYEYAGKFDATEKNKQWAVARRMFIAGQRYALAEEGERIHDDVSKPEQVVLSRQVCVPHQTQERDDE